MGSGNVGGSEQGTSVSLSSDGNILAIGAINDDPQIGATWIFTRSGGVWTQQGAKLVGSGATGSSQQGASVSLSSDGNILAIGGPKDNNFVGATWIFTRSGGVWTQQGAKLVGSGGIGQPNQGISVSLSGDGNTLAVGGTGDNVGQIGATWIFTGVGGVFTQQGAKLVGTGYLPGLVQQGSSVSLSNDGDTLAVGGRFDNYNQGATWIFYNDNIVELYNQPTNNTVTSPISTVTPIGFEFTPSLNGSVSNIQLRLMGLGTTGSRTLTFEIRAGSGVGGTLLVTQTAVVNNILQKTDINIAVATPSILSASTPYTLTVLDTSTIGSGIFYIYGITPGGIYTSFNTTTYPRLTLTGSVDNTSIVQQSDFTATDAVDTSTESGFLIVPEQSGLPSLLSMLISCFDSTNPTRKITLRIRNGSGTAGGVIYSSVYDVNTGTTPFLYNFSLPSNFELTQSTPYTVTITDTTVGGNSTGIIYIYGTFTNSNYTSFNTSVYPKLSIQSLVDTVTWTQPSNPNIQQILSATEIGWRIMPSFSGLLTNIIISLSSYSTTGNRTLRLRIRDGSGLSGSVLFVNDYTIPNMSKSDYTFDITPILLSLSKTYTVSIVDTTSSLTGSSIVYGINSTPSYISYNSFVYPYLVVGVPSYIITLSPPQDLSGFIGDNTDNIEFNTKSIDNASSVYSNSFNTRASTYNLTLKTLTIPNRMINIANGGTLDSYPFIYVTLLNEGNGNNIKTLLSNNNNSILAVFKVQVDKELYGKPTYFFTLKNISGPQRLNFRPDQDIRFRLSLPDGSIITNSMNDYLSPLAPNPLLQVNGTFSIVEL